MPPAADPFPRAAARFAAFFHELQVNYLERDDLLRQMALALLCREHVLFTGPPGTAKSEIAAAVLRRIVDEKTGEPSLFSRQFTESTVQTDLVGPIDFKTLMETGRTEHFTDEGMLGAVHAFLDEVFDGRDMLLRTTLNVLQERELKQGGRTTRGRIECAVMTSNRYVAELLENARDTLLAFVDRVAFVGFVPRGFSDRANLYAVVRRHAGGRGRPTLTCPLTIQDLDVLQAAVDAVHVPESVCDLMVQLVELLDGELGAAVRAVPGFVPTRYLSTRTIVRAGRVLRAATVLDRIVADEDRLPGASGVIDKILDENRGRPLQASHVHLRWLRLHLIASGPEPEAVARLLQNENSPGERRQLEIVRTEREIFDRCLARLPAPAVAPSALEVSVAELAAGKPTVAGTLLAKLEAKLAQARRMQEPWLILDATLDIARAASGGGDASVAARELLGGCVEDMTECALRLGSAGGGLKSRQVVDAVETVSEFADVIDSATPTARALTRWLRGRLVDLITYSAAGDNEGVGIIAGAARATEEQIEKAHALLRRLERLAKLRRELIDRGAEQTDRKDSDTRWGAALGRQCDHQVTAWEWILRTEATRVVRVRGLDKAPLLVEDLRPTLVRFSELASRLEAIGGDGNAFRTRLVAPRIAALLAASFQNPQSARPAAALADVAALREQLRLADLRDLAPAPEIVAWVAARLVRQGWKTPPPLADKKQQRRYDLEAFTFAVTSEEQRPLHDVLLEVALAVEPSAVRAAVDPAAVSAAATATVRALPATLSDEIARLDLARSSRMVQFLESWWSTLAEIAPPSSSTDDGRDVLAAVERIVGSGFLRALRGDPAGSQLVAGTRRIGELFPSHAAAADTIVKRLTDLDIDAGHRVMDLLREREDVAWTQLLATPKK